MEGNAAYSREYSDAENYHKIREQLEGKVSGTFENFQSISGAMEIMRENDRVYDFSSPDFISCITLISALEKPLPLKTITGIAGNLPEIVKRCSFRSSERIVRTP